MIAAELELDLEVFNGPFDLLLTLVLKDEVDLLEVELAAVVLSYVDLLEAQDDLDLEVATEFLVLIAAVLELKSRLMLPREEEDLLDMEPAEAAEELVRRLLEAHRYRSASEHLRAVVEREAGYRFRQAPLPPELTRHRVVEAAAAYAPARLGTALRGLMTMPAQIRIDHLHSPRVTVAERLQVLRGLLARGSRFTFDEAVRGADRVTQCVTIFALLELYKRGEATWSQPELFGEITIEARSPASESPFRAMLEGAA